MDLNLLDINLECNKKGNNRLRLGKGKGKGKGKGNILEVKCILNYDMERDLYEVEWLNGSIDWLNEKDINSLLIKDYHNKLYVNRFNIENGLDESNEKVYIYVRVSSSGGVSLKVQLNSLLEYSKNSKLYVKGLYIDDGISGKNMNKLDSLNLLMSELSEEKNRILVYDISRLSRNVIEALTYLNDSRCEFYFLIENLSYNNVNEKHLIRMGLSQSQHLSELTSEKCKRSNEYRRKRGWHVGKIPYGYKLENRVLVLDSLELNTIKYIYQQYKSDLNIQNRMKCVSKKNMYSRILNKIPRKYNFRGNKITENTIRLCIKRYNKIFKPNTTSISN